MKKLVEDVSDMTLSIDVESASRAVCNVLLCGGAADWLVELFGKAEYYCERHKPGVPETLMIRIEKVQDV